MYKIHSKLVFFLKKILKKLTKTKLNTLYNNNKKKCPCSASEQCKRIALFTIFKWTVQLTWTMKKKYEMAAYPFLRC